MNSLSVDASRVSEMQTQDSNNTIQLTTSNISPRYFRPIPAAGAGRAACYCGARVVSTRKIETSLSNWILINSSSCTAKLHGSDGVRKSSCESATNLSFRHVLQKMLDTGTQNDEFYDEFVTLVCNNNNTKKS